MCFGSFLSLGLHNLWELGDMLVFFKRELNSIVLTSRCEWEHCCTVCIYVWLWSSCIYDHLINDHVCWSSNEVTLKCVFSKERLGTARQMDWVGRRPANYKSSTTNVKYSSHNLFDTNNSYSNANSTNQKSQTRNRNIQVQITNHQQQILGDLML